MSHQAALLVTLSSPFVLFSWPFFFCFFFLEFFPFFCSLLFNPSTDLPYVLFHFLSYSEKSVPTNERILPLAIKTCVGKL